MTTPTLWAGIPADAQERIRAHHLSAGVQDLRSAKHALRRGWLDLAASRLSSAEAHLSAHALLGGGLSHQTLRALAYVRRGVAAWREGEE